MIEFSVLASSSKANCTFVSTSDVSLLIDCGLSARETTKRLVDIGTHPQKLDAIVITHEHSDHIRGAAVLSRKYDIPIYCNSLTAQFLNECPNISLFNTGDTLQPGSDTYIDTASVKHDAVDPLSVSIRCGREKIAILTDTGLPGRDNLRLLEGANALILEANYDEECLDLCEYPWSVKERILSDYGHLSNTAAAKLLAKVWHDDLHYVVLAHISEKSNESARIFEALSQHAPDAADVTFLVGSYEQSTERLRVKRPAVPPEDDTEYRAYSLNSI